MTFNFSSYVDVKDADSYFSAIYGHEAWSSLTDAIKLKALISATMAIDNAPLRGIKASDVQELMFPLSITTYTDVYNPVTGDYDEVANTTVQTTVPDEVIKATLEQAYFLITRSTDDNRVELQEQGVKSVQVGDYKEEYIGAFLSPRTELCKKAYKLIESYLVDASPLKIIRAESKTKGVTGLPPYIPYPFY